MTLSRSTLHAENSKEPEVLRPARPTFQRKNTEEAQEESTNVKGNPSHHWGCMCRQTDTGDIVYFLHPRYPPVSKDKDADQVRAPALGQPHHPVLIAAVDEELCSNCSQIPPLFQQVKTGCSSLRRKKFKTTYVPKKKKKAAATLEVLH